MTTLWRLLEALPAHFAGVAPSDAAATRASQSASQLLQLAIGQRNLDGQQGARLERLLVAVAQSVADLAPAALRAFSRGAPPALVLQLSAGYDAIAGCSMLAGSLQDLSATAAFKIAAACSLAFGPGTALMELLRINGHAGPLLTICFEQLQAVGQAVCGKLAWRQPKAAAAFTSSTGKPATLLPWLRALSQALLFVGAGADASNATGHSSCINYLLMLYDLLETEPYAKHCERLAADRALQQAVADALLQCCLPALAAAVSAAAAAGMPCGGQAAQVLDRLPIVLHHPSLRAAVEQRLQGPAALAAVQAAATVAEALPLSRPADMPARRFLELHAHAVQLLHTTTALMAHQLQAEQGGGGSTPAAAVPASSGNQRQQAAWRLVALVPRLAGVTQALADDPDAAIAYPDDPGCWDRNLGATCVNLSTAVRLLSCLEQQPATPAQLASWAAAAAAGLRLQPLLLRLDASFRQHGLRWCGDGTPLDGAQRLSAALLQHLWHTMPSLQEQEGAAAADSETEQRSLAVRLWELHSAAARLCHFLVSRGSPALAGNPSLSHTELWTALLAQLAYIYAKALSVWERGSANPAAGIPQGNAALQLRALSFAHTEVLVALVGAAGLLDAAAAAPAAGAAADLAELACLTTTDAVLGAAGDVARCAPAAFSPSLGAAVEAVLAPLAQDAERLVEHSSRLAILADAAPQGPLVAVICASGSLLRLLLQAAAKLGGTSNAEQQASKLLCSWDAAVMALAEAASEAVARSVDWPLPEGLAAQLKQAAHSLRQQRHQLLSGLAADASAADRALQLQQLLQPAAGLVALMQQYLVLPTIDVGMRLTMARAAAARSCAYLRCANVAGEGGPAAGQGVGSSRCSACRAVWYCGTACSHADWRAGHRRVCKALGAERRARKQAAVAEAAAAEAAEHEQHGEGAQQPQH